MLWCGLHCHQCAGRLSEAEVVANAYAFMGGGEARWMPSGIGTNAHIAVRPLRRKLSG